MAILLDDIGSQHGQPVPPAATCDSRHVLARMSKVSQHRP
jgi:hypothetical protein